MSSYCEICEGYIARDEDVEECETCGTEICISCMNGQYNCESCLEEEIIFNAED